MISRVGSSQNQYAMELNTDTTKNVGMENKGFQKLDVNSDGKISAEELSNKVAKANEKNGTNFSSEEIIKQVDTNGDNLLDKSEMKKLNEMPMFPRGHQTMQNLNIPKENANSEDVSNENNKYKNETDILKKYDTNTDGILDTSEVEHVLERVNSNNGTQYTISDITQKLGINIENGLDETTSKALEELINIKS